MMLLIEELHPLKLTCNLFIAFCMSTRLLGGPFSAIKPIKPDIILYSNYPSMWTNNVTMAA